MEKFIAVVCDDEATAFRAKEALKGLHKSSDIVVYAGAIISKSPDGEVILHKSQNSGPVNTAFGLLMGAMVGVLAGPAAVAAGAAAAGGAAAATASGIAVGSMTGGLVGMYRDLWVSGIDADVVDTVSTELAPGKSCLVASVEEVWTTPLDVKMQDVGAGRVYRKPRIDVVDDQIAAEMNKLDRELAQLDSELDAVADEMAEDIKEKIDATRESIRSTGAKIDRRMAELDAEFEERVAALDQQIETASDTLKAKFQKRKSELIADYHERKAKLQQASSLAAEALS